MPTALDAVRRLRESGSAAACCASRSCRWTTRSGRCSSPTATSAACRRTRSRGRSGAATSCFLPSRAEEGFGLPLLEAMASGVPAVASRIPSTVHIGDGAVRLVPRRRRRGVRRRRRGAALDSGAPGAGPAARGWRPRRASGRRLVAPALDAGGPLGDASKRRRDRDEIPTERRSERRCASAYVSARALSAHRDRRPLPGRVLRRCSPTSRGRTRSRGAASRTPRRRSSATATSRRSGPTSSYFLYEMNSRAGARVPGGAHRHRGADPRPLLRRRRAAPDPARRLPQGARRLQLAPAAQARPPAQPARLPEPGLAGGVRRPPRAVEPRR